MSGRQKEESRVSLYVAGGALGLALGCVLFQVFIRHIDSRYDGVPIGMPDTWEDPGVWGCNPFSLAFTGLVLPLLGLVGGALIGLRWGARLLQRWYAVLAAALLAVAIVCHTVAASCGIAAGWIWNP